MALTLPKMPPFRRVLQVTAPIIAIFTLMIGLRVGAGEAVHAAVVLGAHPGAPAPDGKTRLAWQVLTFIDDRGVRETIPMKGLTVRATSKGKTSEWKGSSNIDGVAEAALSFEGFTSGDEIELEVRVEGEKEPIASGVAFVPPPPPEVTGEEWRPERRSIRPTAERGAIKMNVLIEGGRLVPGFPTPVWVYFQQPEGLAQSQIRVRALPEPGILAEREELKPCPNGWAEASLVAQAHVVGTKFVATPDLHTRKLGVDAGAPPPADAGATTAADADAGDAAAPNPASGGALPSDVDPKKKYGEWLGVMPVAAGAFYIGIDRVLEENRATSAVLVAPNPRNVAYAEIQDRRGRIVAAALEPKVEPGDPTPRARFEIPPLAAGLYWIVASGEPRGGEHLQGAAIARAFLVGRGPPGAYVNASDLCSAGPYLAQQSAPTDKRWTALDGLPARSAKNRFRHNLGMAIAMISLLAAAILETLLLVAASREARITLQLAELEEEDKPTEAVTAKPPGGGLAIALLIAILGFALLAALLVAKA